MLSLLIIGIGKDCTIRELVKTMADAKGYTGGIIFDRNKLGGPL
jgi:hypothetical protein